MKISGLAICLALTSLGAYAAWRGALGAGFAEQHPSSTQDPKLQALEELGNMYAKQTKLSLTKVEMTVAGTVTDDSAAWVKRLEEALTVGYAPDQGVLALIPFSDIKPFMLVTMGSGITPEETVKRVVSPGNVVVRVTWYFAGVDPLRSYSVFLPQDDLVFDTTLSMPLVRGRLFGTGH
jgi:hypothetical protein